LFAASRAAAASRQPLKKVEPKLLNNIIFNNF